MDSNELNKIAGAVIGSLLLFLLLGFFSSQLFGTGGGHHHEETLAFALEIEEEETADAGSAEEEEPEAFDLAGLVADADVAAGEKHFNKCKACHKIEDGVNGVGPHLWNVVGREIAAIDGYAYSDALAGMDGAWDLDHLLGFLENPGDWAPGTKMGYAGLRGLEDRVDLIAYLNEAGDAPADLQAMVPAQEADAGETADEGTEVAAADAEAGTEAETATDSGAAEEAGADEATEAEAGETATSEETEVAAADSAAEPAEETAAEDASGDENTEAAEDASGDEGTEMAAAGAASGGAYADLLANADAGAGEKVFRKCRACHKVDEGKNGVGPSLWGVVGADIASVDGYRYSDALASVEGEWTLDQLMTWLENPSAFAKGTKMAYALRDAQERIDVITYLNEADGSPEPLQ